METKREPLDGSQATKQAQSLELGPGKFPAVWNPPWPALRMWHGVELSGNVMAISDGEGTHNTIQSGMV